MDPRIQDQPMEGDSLRSARQMAEDTRRLVDEIDTRVDPNGMTAAFEELTNMAHRLKEEIGALEERLSYVLVEPTVNDNAFAEGPIPPRSMFASNIASVASDLRDLAEWVATIRRRVDL